MTDATANNESLGGATSPVETDALWKPGSEAGEATAPGRGTGMSDPPADQESASSPWSSGSGAVFAPAAAPVFDDTGPSDAEGPIRRAETEPPPARARRRRLVIGVMLVAALGGGAAVLVRSPWTAELSAEMSAEPVTAADSANSGEAASSGESLAPLVTEPFVGADRRRLPEQLDQRWRTDVSGVSATGRTELTVRDDGAVIGVFDDDTVDDGQAASVVALFDGADGSEQWRTAFDSQASAFDVLGIFGDVIALERLDTDNRSVLGVSGATGEVLWVRDTSDPGVHVALEGTETIARVTFTVNARLTFIDPATGDEVGRLPGRLFATDFRGTWYVRNAAAVSKLELRDGWNPPTPFETLWVDDDEPASVIGDRLIVINNGRLELRGADGEPTSVDTIGAGSGGFGSIDTGVNFTQLSPMVGDTFVAVRSRSVYGARIDDNGDAAVRWRATGTPIESVPTERGLALVVATEGGGSQSVIDASTGNEIAVLEMVAGSIDTLQLVGNGVVVKQSAEVGFERVGLDLDGNRLWALVGDGPLAIGSGVVVTFGPSDSGIAITAYGDAAP